MAIFLDTSFYIAFFNKRDKYHSRAMKIIQELKKNKYGKLFTSLEVIDELFTFFQRKRMHDIADKLLHLWFKERKMLGTLLFTTEES